MSGADSEIPPENWVLETNVDGTVENEISQSNAISTTKYTIWSWLPVSLGEQFKRIANVYFAVISILMLIGKYQPSIFQTPLDPFSTIVTFIFVLGVTCIKEGNEDYKRAKNDRVANEKMVTIITFDKDGSVIETQKHTAEIKGGDIVKLMGPTMQVPVDMLLCMSSNWADGNQCYIETANIDGETNLKLKNAPADLKDFCADGVPRKECFEGKIEFEPANKYIYNFMGAFHNKASSNTNGIPLGPEHILLRSSLFSNTDWGYGIALYTGQETKIQMNNRKTESKMSGIERLANKAIIMVFFAQVLLCTATVIVFYAQKWECPENLPYVNLGAGPGCELPSLKESGEKLPLFFRLWFVFFLLFNNFIPISLYVTIEMINVGQGILISKDEKIYCDKLDLSTQVRSTNLAQELGMVSNIFSDKTGTLTCNEMRFVKFIVDDIMYDVDPVESAGTTASGPSDDLLPGTHLPNTPTIYNFLRCLTTCHTVIREKDGTYRAESPDELALVEGASKLNCNVKERGTVDMSCSMFGEDQQYKVLAINAFNSERKRMSVILKSNKGEYFMMCKGADNIMIPLCAMRDESKESVQKHLLNLAKLGLRTLVIGQKKLDTAVAEAWLMDYAKAAASMEDRAKLMDECAARLEMGMELLGITAIEDRLQDNVPEVIADLAKGGITLWMLTGDKEETAVNIGRSCELVLPNSKLFMLCGLEAPKDADPTSSKKILMQKYGERLREIYEDIDLHWVEGDSPATTGYMDPTTHLVTSIVLVMDGPTFSFFDYSNPDEIKHFLSVGSRVRSVIACRLTPNQKESVVRLVKTNTVPKATCLSIGDGANDVSMILEADVGVGIFGKEGRQAANNADFAIGQFQFLKRLLLVHGRLNYVRQSQAFLYSMHKNAVITFMLFWYTFYTAVSGTSPFQSWIYAGFNLILGLPAVFYGILDRDLSQDFLEKNPQTYATGQKNVYLSGNQVISWIANAVAYAVILCAIFYYAFEPTFQSWNIYTFGATAYTGLVMALQCKMIFMHNQWAYPQAGLMLISILGMLFFYWVVQYWAFGNFYGAVGYLYQDTVFWLFGMFSVPGIMMVFEALWYYSQMFFSPTDEMMFREVMHKEKFMSDCLMDEHTRDAESTGLVSGSTPMSSIDESKNAQLYL